MFMVVSEPDGKFLNETASQKAHAQQNGMAPAESRIFRSAVLSSDTLNRCWGRLLLLCASDGEKVTCTNRKRAGKLDERLHLLMLQARMGLNLSMFMAPKSVRRGLSWHLRMSLMVVEPSACEILQA